MSLQQSGRDPDFLSCVLFMDEAAFTLDSIVNFHNLHTSADVSPHNILESRHQQRFPLKIWAGVLGDQLIGRYFIQLRLTGASYLEFYRTACCRIYWKMSP
jgi:hypothetical protein